MESTVQVHPWTLQQWQSLGFDLGTIVKTTPDVQTIIEWGRQMLQYST